MKTFRALALVFLLMTGGCGLLAEFVVLGIEAAVHEIDHDDPPPPPPPHRSPRVLDRTRLR